MKKCISLAMAIVLSFSFCMTSHAGNIDETVHNQTISSISEIENIINTYQNRAASIRLRSDIVSSEKSKMIVELLNACEKSIIDSGFEAYIIDSTSFHIVEEKLKTDLSKLGLSPEYSYLAILSGENNPSIKQNGNISPASSVSADFNYTYNGTTYTMRYLTVTAADDPSFAKASDCNLLTSSSTQLITNCLNTAISAYISAVWAPLGTVASICGLDIADFAPSKSATLRLNAGTNWTRVYTEVYSSYDKQWNAGACVEYAKLFSHMSGTYYEASSNAMKSVPGNESSSTQYSSQFFNTEWRKQKAAIAAFNGSGCTYDVTGAVSYYYGEVKKLTHAENF